MSPRTPLRRGRVGGSRRAAPVVLATRRARSPGGACTPLPDGVAPGGLSTVASSPARAGSLASITPETGAGSGRRAAGGVGGTAPAAAANAPGGGAGGGAVGPFLRPGGGGGGPVDLALRPGGGGGGADGREPRAFGGGGGEGRRARDPSTWRAGAPGPAAGEAFSFSPLVAASARISSRSARSIGSVAASLPAPAGPLTDQPPARSSMRPMVASPTRRSRESLLDMACTVAQGPPHGAWRSEERRVGKEGSCRWSLE